MQLLRDGAQHHPAVLDAATLAALETILAAAPADRAGTRLHNLPGLAEALRISSPIGAIAAVHLGAAAHPVRALLFDKTAANNWSLAWHQDRTIAVRSRIDTPGFGPWTIKSGIPHAAPPFDLLAAMVTLRVHLDPVDVDNAPLLIAPGSHREGRIDEPAIADIVARLGTFACLAKRGDVWAYATPILHASATAAHPRHRRVLQIDYSADALPGGLQWLGL